MDKPTQKQLDALLAKWQKVLRLQDWDVKISLKRGRDMAIENTQGDCNWSIKKKMAMISIIDPIDYPDDTQWGQDIEATLVHELLHLHFAPFDKTTDDPDDIAREQAIECIATALVGLERRAS